MKQAAIALVLALMLATPAVAQMGDIGGTVTDSVTALPIEGAWVRAIPAVAPTPTGGHGGHHGGWHYMDFSDATGAYLIEDLAVGDYTVEVRKFDYVTATVAVTVVDATAAVVDVALVPVAYGAIGGMVTDSVTGLPLENAFVFVRPATPSTSGGHWGGWFFGYAMTDATGAYTIDNLVAGDYTVKVRKTDYVRAEVAATVVANTSTLVDVALVPIAYGSVTGIITDSATGLPIENARVKVCRDVTTSAGSFGMWWGHHALTDATGAYTIDNVVIGDYTIRASKPGYSTGTSTVFTVADGLATTADLALDPVVYGSVNGIVTDSVTLLPIENAFVLVHMPFTTFGGHHHGWGLRWARTDATGYYEILDVPAGQYSARARARGYERATATIDVVGNAATVADFALVPW